MKCSAIGRCTPAAIALVLLAALGCGGAGGTLLPGPAAPQIVFASSRALDGSNNAQWVANIWVINSDGTDAKPLTRLTAFAVNSGSPAWSPDGTKIVFKSRRDLNGTDGAMPRTLNIWEMNADGTDVKPLTQFIFGIVFTYGPRWSPAGDKISFFFVQGTVYTPPGDAHIVLMNADGTGEKTLPNVGDSRDPEWSPDGTKVLYSSNSALDPNDFTTAAANMWDINADGTDAKPLTRHIVASNFGGIWSPDGKKIAYISAQALDGSDTAAGANLWIMNSDGTGERPLTKFNDAYNINMSELVWSPDGTKIAFTCSAALDAGQTSGVKNIWVVGADGTDVKPLTKLTAADNVNPAWSSDGRRIAFASNRALNRSDSVNVNETWNIWVMNADGGGAIPLTANTALGASSNSPQWHP